MNSIPTIPSSAFRAYDIRGVAGRDFNTESVFLLGRAAGSFFLRKGQRRAVTGRDCRVSSPEYHKALCRGLMAAGIHVIDAGPVPTPVFYHAAAALGVDAGVMVTASHNPPEYNGFKIWSNGLAIYGQDISCIQELLVSGRFAHGQGFLSMHNVLPAYIESLTKRIQPFARPLLIVVDGGNGMGGTVCADILESLGARVIRQFCEPDGNFPHHHPDPSVECNMRLLQERVVRENADFGIGLDGDADRLGVVDECGRLLYGDELCALFARDVLKRRPGSLILADVKSSVRLFDDIRTHGGRAAFSPTGHSLIKAMMKARNAAFAGDVSGHMYFDAIDWFGFDDALYGAAKLTRIVSESPVRLSALPGWKPCCSTPEILVPCDDAWKGRVIKEATAYFQTLFSETKGEAQILDIDGVRLDFHDGWLLLRASNTQPALTLRFEATTEKRMNSFKQLARNVLEKISKQQPENEKLKQFKTYL